MFYLTTHWTHFIYGYMASDIWLRTILIVRKKTRCCQMGYSFRLAARVLLYAPSHRQDSTYHGLCYTSLLNKDHNVYDSICHQLCGKSVNSWCDRSSDRSFMVDPFNHFLLHDWCNKGHGMCYPACRMMHIKEPLEIVAHVAAAGFLPRYLSGPLPYVWRHITENKMCRVRC